MSVEKRGSEGGGVNCSSFKCALVEWCARKKFIVSSYFHLMAKKELLMYAMARSEEKEKENLFNAAYKSVLLNIFAHIRLTSHSFQLSLFIAIILALNT